MTDAGIVAAYERAIARAGQPVTFERRNGVAPNIAIFTATVKARVMTFAPDAGSVGRTDFSENKLGAITQTQRKIIVLASDLQAAGFPLPLKKNDKAIITTNGVTETFNVTAVDPNTRQLGGAIELDIAGV